MVRWVGRLGRIRVELSQRMGQAADWQEKQGVAEGSFDLQLGWALVSRAARWTRALRTWMREAAAAVPDEVEPVRLPGASKPRSAADRVPRAFPIAASQPRYGRTDCIKGLTVGEVVAQICADLADAATLLRAVKAGKAIARIARAARALLAGPDETWTKLPPPQRWSSLAEAAKLTWPDATLPAAPAPDSG